MSITETIYTQLLKPVLFRMDPENAHELVSQGARGVMRVPGVASLLPLLFGTSDRSLQITVDGVVYPNPVGMAAGFDKQGDLYPFLSAMGFGFVESGTFTAHPQPGNPKPRLFRFPKYNALINRMGFNNGGSEAVARLLATQKKSIPRGINIGKSKVTPLEDAVSDYTLSIKRLASYGDYLVLNVSSPNTPGLRKLQGKEELEGLLNGVSDALSSISIQRGKRLPLYLKVAPDISNHQADDIARLIFDQDLHGVVVSNTTLDKSSLPESDRLEGGLSGPAVKQRSTELIRHFYSAFRGRKTVIGVGGIFNGPDALEKILAGASLVQIYTGYIYRGPTLPWEINLYLWKYCQDHGLPGVANLVGAEKSI